MAERGAELEALQARLESQRQELERDRQAETEEIARRWQELKDEIQRMESLATQQKVRVMNLVINGIFGVVFFKILWYCSICLYICVVYLVYFFKVYLHP